MVEILKWVLLVVLIVGGAWASMRITREKDTYRGEIRSYSVRAKVAALTALLALGYMFILMPAVGQVSAGYRGVVLSFGAVTGQILGEGLYLVVPVANTVVGMDVQTHAYAAQASAASYDLQAVKTEVTLNYHLDPSRVAGVYQNLRQDYTARIIAPAVQESVKANTAKYPAEKLITHRELVKAGIEESLRERLAVHGIVVVATNITDFAFSKEFDLAIEAKVEAEQRALKAERDLVRIRTEAEQRIAQAMAEAEAIRITAEALMANPQLVQLEAVKKWDGKLPQYVLGDAVPFIGLPAATR